MRAVTITSFGGVEGLEIREVPDAAKAVADRVRLRVRAAGLNRADILQRQGRYPAPPGYSQEIPGMEFAGEVESAGDEVRRWKVGDRVFGIIGGGGQAEYVTISESHLAGIPSNLNWAEAAAVPEVFMTAHDALFTQGHLTLGESVLIHAAGSGVGTAAIQLVREAGGFSFGTSRTEAKLKSAKALGLTDSFVAAGDPMEMVDTVLGFTGGDGVNVVLDLVGAAYLKANLKSLATRGRLIFVGTTAGNRAELDYSLVMGKRLHLMGTSLRTRSAEEKATATRLFDEQVVPLLATGAVRPVIDQIFELEDVRAAHERLESNESFGKVVLTI